MIARLGGAHRKSPRKKSSKTEYNLDDRSHSNRSLFSGHMTRGIQKGMAKKFSLGTGGMQSQLHLHKTVNLDDNVNNLTPRAIRELADNHPDQIACIFQEAEGFWSNPNDQNDRKHDNHFSGQRSTYLNISTPKYFRVDEFCVNRSSGMICRHGKS